MPEMIPIRAEEGPRRPYLLKKHFEQHKYTEGCDGCGTLVAGMKTKKPHNDKCRNRMYEEMKKTDEGRKWLEEAENKLNEYFEEKLKEDHGDPDAKEQEVDPAVPAAEVPDAGMEPETAQQSQNSSPSGPVYPPVFRGARGSVQKERSEDDEPGRAAKKARADPSLSPSTQTVVDAASGSASSPSATTNAGGAAAKRGMEDAWDADEAPEKTQKLNSVCVGLGSSDKAGESLKEEYEEDLKEMVEAYKTCSERGGCFVHIRKKQSSNRDLRALSCLTKGTKL
jgi:hypothetical protein